MDGAETTLYPRHLANELPSSGRPVCIVGQVLNISESNSLTLDCDPENKLLISVEVPGNVDAAPLREIKYIEVRGVCGESGEIVLKEFTDLKENFDLKSYNEIVALASKEFRDIFNYQQ